MPRSISESCPTRPGNVEAWPATAFETLDLQIQVVTPMFGGGAEAGEPDPVTLIRPSSIRGHLRFWWRATRGAACQTIEELKRREVEIFGDTEHPSPVIVEVKVTSKGTTRPCAFLPPGKSFPKFADDHPAYALFPFQGNAQKGIPIGAGTVGTKFLLRVRCPLSLRQDILASVWAWINFGGLGARTRRGCGSLVCKDFSPTSCQPDVLRRWIQDSDNHLSPFVASPRFSTGLGRVLFGVSQQQPLVAWNLAVSVLRDFRQGAGIGRTGTQGRSFWPEPETIRRLTGQRLEKHEPQNIPSDGFPRAEFGLPIVFHFKDGARNLTQRNVDPIDTELYPIVGGERRSRMASPLIIKALATADGKAVPLIVSLQTPALEQVELVHKQQEIEGARECAIRGRQLADYEKSPMKQRNQQGSAIEAFLAFATQDRKFASLGEEVQP